MKNSFYLFYLLVLISCQKEYTLTIQDVASSLKVDKKQIIEFSLKNDTILIGLEGTKVFVPKNLFKNYSNGLITLELIEYYDFDDIVLNSIETITNDNQLLETSGVLYVNFKENGKPLILSEQASYKVQVSKIIKSKNKIYYNDDDAFFRWELSDEKIYIQVPDILKNLKYGLTVNKDNKGGYYKKIHIDSIAGETRKDSMLIQNLTRGNRNNMDYLLLEDLLIFQGNIDSLTRAMDPFYITENLIFEFNATRLGYINIDRILEYDKLELITIVDKTKSFKNLNISYIYLDNDSFYNSFWEDSSLGFEEEVKIKGKIKVVVYSIKNDKIYFDSFYVDSKPQKTFEINLREITIEKLKQQMLR